MTYATATTTVQKTVVELTVVEISFYDHEIHAGQKLIARITHDDDLTQPWVVTVNGEEIHRADTFNKCHSYIQWHHKRGTLPVQEQEAPAATTGNEVMVIIADECENYGFELLDDGIYNKDQKLGKVGCTNGQWWVIPASSGCQIECDSVMDAVSLLSISELLSDWKPPSCEELLDKPLEKLTAHEWQRLRGYEPASQRDLATV